MMGAIFAAFIVELGLITYRGAAAKTLADNPIAGLPVPAEYGGAFIVFGALSLFSGRATTPAAVFAWGLVLATALNFFTETEIPGITFLSPSTPTAAPTRIGA